MRKLMFKEKRAKELLLKILEDLNKRFKLKLCVRKNRFCGTPELWIANKNYFENRKTETTMNLLGISGKKPTYAMLFNKLVRQPIYNPAFQRKIVFKVIN